MTMIEGRELAAARYVAAVVAGIGDARRVSNTLRQPFTVREREELAWIARRAMIDLRKNQERAIVARRRARQRQRSRES